MKRLLLSLLLLIPLATQAELVLRQSTASQIVMVGPFVDSTDGATLETALTIDAADVLLSKNGAAFAAKNSGGCTAASTTGYYACTFNATDSDTVGRLQVIVNEAGALPVYHEFSVASPSVYDACCTSTSAPLTAADVWVNGTRTLTAATNITSTGGTITVSTGAVTVGTNNDKTGYSIGTGGITASSLAADTITAAKIAADVSTEIWSLSCTEPAAKPSWGSTNLQGWVCWIGAWSRNEINQTATTKTLRNDADTADLVTCAVSDDGTTFAVQECAP